MKVFNKKGDKDERAISVENSSYSIAYNIINYALLVDVMYRSIVFKQGSWDLLGIVILGGLAATLYQARYKTATRSSVKAILLTIVSALVIAAALIFSHR
jgi:hypothetical protein